MCSVAPPTTTVVKSCFLDLKQGLELNSNALAFLVDRSEFDGSVDDCKAKCKSNQRCLSVNYYRATEPITDPSQCILHDIKCSDVSTNSSIVCGPRADTEYYEKDPTASLDCK